MWQPRKTLHRLLRRLHGVHSVLRQWLCRCFLACRFRRWPQAFLPWPPVSHRSEWLETCLLTTTLARLLKATAEATAAVASGGARLRARGHEGAGTGTIVAGDLPRGPALGRGMTGSGLAAATAGGIASQTKTMMTMRMKTGSARVADEATVKAGAITVAAAAGAGLGGDRARLRQSRLPRTPPRRDRAPSHAVAALAGAAPLNQRRAPAAPAHLPLPPLLLVPPVSPMRWPRPTAGAITTISSPGWRPRQSRPTRPQRALWRRTGSDRAAAASRRWLRAGVALGHPLPRLFRRPSHQLATVPVPLRRLLLQRPRIGAAAVAETPTSAARMRSGRTP